MLFLNKDAFSFKIYFLLVIQKIFLYHLLLLKVGNTKKRFTALYKSIEFHGAQNVTNKFVIITIISALLILRMKTFMIQSFWQPPVVPFASNGNIILRGWMCLDLFPQYHIVTAFGKYSLINTNDFGSILRQTYLQFPQDISSAFGQKFRLVCLWYSNTYHGYNHNVVFEWNNKLHIHAELHHLHYEIQILQEHELQSHIICESYQYLNP